MASHSSDESFKRAVGILEANDFRGDDSSKAKLADAIGVALDRSMIRYACPRCGNLGILTEQTIEKPIQCGYCKARINLASALAEVPSRRSLIDAKSILLDHHEAIHRGSKAAEDLSVAIAHRFDKAFVEGIEYKELVDRLAGLVRRV